MVNPALDWLDGLWPVKLLTRDECLMLYGVSFERDGQLIQPEEVYIAPLEPGFLIIDEASDIPDGMFERVMSKNGNAKPRHHPIPETPRSPRRSR
jgi:hypothetical protein